MGISKNHFGHFCTDGCGKVLTESKGFIEIRAALPVAIRAIMVSPKTLSDPQQNCCKDTRVWLQATQPEMQFAAGWHPNPDWLRYMCWEQQ